MLLNSQHPFVTELNIPWRLIIVAKVFGKDSLQ
jgi:hypothetical protein